MRERVSSGLLWRCESQTFVIPTEHFRRDQRRKAEGEPALSEVEGNLLFCP